MGLEKSRITQQQEVERSYHIFYQLLQPFVPTLKAKCQVTDDIYDYQYVSQGKVTVASIDDNEELEMTDSAFDIIGFSEEEKWDCYKLTAGVMTCGQVVFVQKGRDDQAEIADKDWEYPEKVASLFGVEKFDYNGFEQISINFVNEKLQQFFNNHMFVV